MNKSKLSRLVHNAMFSVISLILAFLGNISLFPVFPYLKADISDMPIYLATLLCGPASGVLVLLTVSTIRALLFSTSGFIGFIMRLTTIVTIICLGISKNKKTIPKLTILFFGIILSVILKIIINYFCWINFFSIPEETIKSLLFTVILPYNSIKTVTCVVLAMLFNARLSKYIKKEVSR